MIDEGRFDSIRFDAEGDGSAGRGWGLLAAVMTAAILIIVGQIYRTYGSRDLWIVMRGDRIVGTFPRRRGGTARSWILQRNTR
jgi:hypothetical protein